MPARRPLVRSLLTLVAIVGLACSSPSEPREPQLMTLSVGVGTIDAIGGTFALVATVRDADNRPIHVSGVAWTSSDPQFATVAQNGVVTAVANGASAITATYGTFSASATITVAQVAVAPVIVAGNFQQGTVTEQLADSIRVRVRDRLGVAIPGKTVTFTVTSGAGTVGAPTAVSAADGLAANTWTLGNSTTQAHLVTVSVEGSTATASFSATALAGPATVLRVAPGNLADGQIGDIGQPVPVRPAAQLIDAFGNGVAGATVNFAITVGSGSVTGAAAVTAANGVATVGSWTLAAAEGPNVLRATHQALTPVDFTATGVADRCSAAGATVLTVGTPHAGALIDADCPIQVASRSLRYDYYRFDVPTRTSYAIELSSNVIDTFLGLYDIAGDSLITENDDIVLGVITNSRITITLDPGSYLIRARPFEFAELGAYEILVRVAQVGVPAKLIPVAPDGQVAAPGANVGTPPSVRVVDELDAPIAGVSVTFATVPGVGSATGTAAVTDANGLATVGSWTLAAGANVMSATTNNVGTVDGDPIIFSAKGKASTAGFDVDLRFVAMPTANQLTTFGNAAARWEAIITGDVSNWATGPLDVGECGNARAINETADDVIIIVRLVPIDGSGGTLGSAGPCLVRSPSVLPLLGVMEFDSADLANLEAGGGFGDVILHEMGHVLGFGTIWSDRGFLQLPSPTTGTGNDTHFNGAFAVAAFNTIGGSTYVGAKVPVENSQGGAGTRNSHWREGVFGRELMTGFYNGGVANPLSIVTVQSMRDLGYVVDNGAADNYVLSASVMSAEGPPAGPTIHLKDDVRTGTIHKIERGGRRVGAPAPGPRRKEKPRR